MRPVVFLHGIGQTPQSWQDQVVALPAGTTMLAPWLSGLRPGATHGFELDRAAAEVLTQLDARGAERAHLVASSLGAAVAVRVASTAPDRVARLLLADPIVSPPRPAVAVQKAVMRLLPRRAFGSVNKADALAAVAGLAELDLTADLPRVVARTLVLTGDGDRLQQVLARQLADGIKDAELVVMAGGRVGRHLNTERPQEFNQTMVAFLAAEEGDQPDGSEVTER